MAIQSMGVGSGIDIGSLVKQLVAAEATPKQFRLTQREADVQQKISAMGALKGALSNFHSSYFGLTLASTYAKFTATSSTTSNFTASASGSGVATGSHSIEVLALAQQNKLASTATADVSNSIGTGTITVDFGSVSGGVFTQVGASNTITVTDGSMSGIRDAINAANIGVSASIVYNGTGYQLVTTSDYGASKAMRISVTGDSDGNDTDNAGLSSLVFDPAAAGIQNQTETQAAQDASVRVDGITVSGTSNTMTNILEGVTLNLKSASPGTVGTLKISTDASPIETAVRAFVLSYNDLIKQIKQLTFYNKDTGEKGLFLGDSVVRGIESSIKSLLNKSYGNPSDPSNIYSSLASLGIKTGEDGTLSYDEDKLSSLLGSHFSEIKQMFMGGVNNSGATGVTFNSTPSNLDLPRLGVDITQAATKASYTSAAIVGGPTYNMTAADILSLRIDGQAAIDVSTVSGTYTPAQLASQMQSAINNALIAAGQTTKSVTVNYDTGTQQFSVLSNTWGSSSSIEITNSQGNYIFLGFAAAAASTGIDVAGTIGGLSATGSGQTLTGSGQFSGVSLDYSGSTADSLRFKLVKGVFNEMDDLYDRMIANGGIFSARSDKYQRQLDQISDDQDRLATRIDALQSRYEKQFSAMDTIVAKLNNLSTYLAGQLPGLNSLVSRK